MKKLFLSISICACFSATAQKPIVKKDTVQSTIKPAAAAPENKETLFNIYFTVPAMQVLFTAIDQSEMPHKQAEELKNYILAQIKKQSPDAVK